MPQALSVTELLNNVRQGDQVSVDQLVPLIYTELRRIAGGCLRKERSGHTLQPTALAKFDAQKARLVQMRFFGGLTAEESAQILGMPVQTVRRELRVAQAWLKRELDRTAGQNSRNII